MAKGSGGKGGGAKGGGAKPAAKPAGKAHRSAVSGQYVTRSYAKANPTTTVSESKPKPSKPSKKG